MFNIDYSNRWSGIHRTSESAGTLAEAIATAQALIADHPTVSARIFDSSDKQVAMVTANVTQTLATDPGF